MDVYFPKKSHNGYFDKSLRRVFYSKKQKEEFLKAHNLRENVPTESKRHEVNRLVDEINYEREKRGEKTLTKDKLMGNSQEYREWKFR